MNLSVKQKTAVSVAFVLAAFAAGILATSLFVPFWIALLLWMGAIVITLALAELWPLSAGGLASNPSPAADFDDALARFEKHNAKPEAAILPDCTAHILHHNRRTRKAYVLVHGISNCPFSMIDFAPRLHALGHNVLIARMPYNGHLDNTTNALKHITARELKEFSDDCIDIAAGLGERVTVIGISAGGVIAGWMGQNRDEIDRAVLIAPSYGLSSFGTGLNHTLMRLMLFLPNFSVWKDPIRRSRAPSRAHSYKRQATRGMGHVMKLGLATAKQARAGTARAASITLITNAADHAVDISMSRAIARLWEGGGTPLTRFEFPAKYQLPHEMIDPTETGARPEITYPKIIELAERPPIRQAVGNTRKAANAFCAGMPPYAPIEPQHQQIKSSSAPTRYDAPPPLPHTIENDPDKDLVYPKIIVLAPRPRRDGEAD